jgi:hypothetical protein
MKYLLTHIRRFLIVAAALICGYFALTTGRTAGADSTKNSARPAPDLRGPAAIRHLEQTGLYTSLSAAVTAARYQIEARKEGGHEAANPRLKLSGDLKARLGESRQAIMLNGKGAGAGLRYDNLPAFDATGRELEAKMKLAGDQIRIEVADEGAIYPVTIDPTLTQQQKLEASDAEALDLFGRSAAVSGETVVIGPRFHGGAAGQDQGSAYVFASANQPPDCDGAFPSLATIWPPNHDMVNVTIQGVTDPDGDPVTINIDQIKQDELTDGALDGHTCPDGAGIGTSTAQVRAERSARGDGRIYTIYFTASDGKGGSRQSSVSVCAPKSRNGSCTNDGANFDSTRCDTSLNWRSGNSATTHWLYLGKPAYWEKYGLSDGILRLLDADSRISRPWLAERNPRAIYRRR